MYIQSKSVHTAQNVNESKNGRKNWRDNKKTCASVLSVHVYVFVCMSLFPIRIQQTEIAFFLVSFTLSEKNVLLNENA